MTPQKLWADFKHEPGCRFITNGTPRPITYATGTKELVHEVLRTRWVSIENCILGTRWVPTNDPFKEMERSSGLDHWNRRLGLRSVPVEYIYMNI